MYPHRWAVPREAGYRLFNERASPRSSILAYSSLFLAEDSGLLDVIAARAKAASKSASRSATRTAARVAERGMQEGIDDAMAAKIRNALALYQPLRDAGNAEIRLHRTVLYNSIYRADDDMLVNQHAYGIPGAHAPVFHLHRSPDDRHVRQLPRQLRAHLASRCPDLVISRSHL